jgi:hypothetical protein
MTAQSKYDNYDDTQLAKGIKLSLKLSDGAGKAQAIEAGLMLAEARKRYPADVDFEKFLVSVDGVGLSRARDLIGFAEGRKDWDKHQADNRAAGERHWAKVKADKQEAVQLANRLKAKVEKAETAALAKPLPPPPFVSETTLIKAAPLANGANPDPKTPKLTAATMKAALPVATAPPIANPVDWSDLDQRSRDIEEDEAARMDVALLKRAQIIALDMVAKGEPLSSDGALASFRVACEMYLSSDVMNEADQKAALDYARCISDDADTDDDEIAISILSWPPIYAEAA